MDRGKNPQGEQAESEIETHQTAQEAAVSLTTQQGVPIGDDQNTLKIGFTGPALLEDMIFREKLFHFDHERIPERVVHARGFGGHGYFENYDSLAEITKADLFQRAHEKTPVFVRFSTVVGSLGSPDLARDVRGFAVKFYTRRGNWDLVGNNMPVFFIQDPIKFPDLVHAAKPRADAGFPQAQTAHDNFWDFISLMPESMHMVMWVMSDRAIPRSYRFMEGFGVHTFRLVNVEGKSTFVKFHWKPKLGLQSVTWEEAAKINGIDPDFHRRDLWKAIQLGDFPEWELGFQLFDESFLSAFPFDTLDPTKLIPEEEVPIRKVGKLVLNRCVDNFFAETEQVAFCTQNIIPGIDFSNDPLLQGRNFSYLDTQLKRLGSPNFTQLPINAPRCPMHLFQQDGHMAFRNPKGRVNYEPNSWDNKIKESAELGFKSFPEKINYSKGRYRSTTFSDHYSQARQFYISQTLLERQHIAKSLVFELSKVEREDIRLRMIAHLLNIDESLAQQVRQGLGIDSSLAPAVSAIPIKKLPVSPALSILKNGPRHFAGRVLGIVVTDGLEASLIQKIVQVLKKEKVTYEIIASKIQGIRFSSGERLSADQTLESGPSVLYDAILLLVSAGEKARLAHEQNIKNFIAEAFAHGKFIGYSTHAKELLDKIDGGCFCINQANIHEFIALCVPLRHWERMTKINI